MNRRTSIISILGLGLVSTSTFSVFKWFSINKVPDHKLLLSKKDLIAELAEMIIPETDTPGAKSAKAGEFIVKMILNCTDVKNQNIFIEGLANVEKYSKDQFDNYFENCNYAEKTKILSHFDEKAHRSNRLINKIEDKYWGKPFFTQLKELTVISYCTSEPGATKGLAYDFIPVTFESCIKLEPHQKSWATK
jgi:hypothetical protein